MRLEEISVKDKEKQCGPIAMYFPHGHQPDETAKWELHRSSDKAFPQSYIIGRSVSPW